MHDGRLMLAFARVQAIELDLCLRCTRIGFPRVLGFFGIVSRLGDGPFWLAMLPLMMLMGAPVGAAVLHLALVALVSTATYRAIKHRTARPRPFAASRLPRSTTRSSHPASGRIPLLVQPLDRYSFPSGHTMHAASCCLVMVHYVPALAWLTVPFAIMVAMSRVLLGLHYPTDVVAGAALGTTLAALSIGLLS